jgi:hypothetical protein
MIGFIDALYTELGTTGNYSAIADLHTLQFTVAHALGFSVFTSRILATDISQSHCNFKLHSKSSCHSLILSCRFFSTTLDCHFQNSTHFFTTTNCSLRTCRFIASGRIPHKTPSSLVPVVSGVLFTDSLPINKQPIVARVGSPRECVYRVVA